MAWSGHIALQVATDMCLDASGGVQIQRKFWFSHPSTLCGPGLLTQLTSLLLNANHFKHVPDGISQLTALKAFGFSAPALQPNHMLSEALLPLTALIKLHLQQCNFKVVPDVLSSIAGLRELDLSWNKLRLVPCKMPWQKVLKFHLRLQTMFLRGNQLRSMPCAALSDAQQLQYLDCGNNLPMQVSLLASDESHEVHLNIFKHIGV